MRFLAGSVLMLVFMNPSSPDQHPPAWSARVNETVIAKTELHSRWHFPAPKKPPVKYQI